MKKRTILLGLTLTFLAAPSTLQTAIGAEPSKMPVAAEAASPDRSCAIKLAQSAAKTHIVQFPDSSVGKIIVLNPHFDVTDKKLSGLLLCQAQGKVELPTGKHLMFLANDYLSSQMEILNSLPPDAFECLVLTNLELDDSKLAPVAKLTGLRHLELDGTDVSDRSLEKLKSLVNLEYLAICHTAMRGSCLKSLANLKKMLVLKISGNELADGALQGVAAFPRLQLLALDKCGLKDQSLIPVGKCSLLNNLLLTDNPKITNNGMRNISSLKQLTRLDVRNTSVTGAGLMLLKECPIKILKVSRSSVTAEQLLKLKAVLAGANIAFDDRFRMESPEVFSPLH